MILMLTLRIHKYLRLLKCQNFWLKSLNKTRKQLLMDEFLNVFKNSKNEF